MSQPPAETRCLHKDAANRQCRLPRISEVVTLCPAHARQLLRSLEPPRDLSKELLGPIDDFHTAAAVNHALGRIFVLLAGNRIPKSQAAALTYVCQLMLQSLKGVKGEILTVSDSQWREEELNRVFDSLPALSHKLGAGKA
jgi:hypothetical protein